MKQNINYTLIKVRFKPLKKRAYIFFKVKIYRKKINILNFKGIN